MRRISRRRARPEPCRGAVAADVAGGAAPEAQAEPEVPAERDRARSRVQVSRMEERLLADSVADAADVVAVLAQPVRVALLARELERGPAPGPVVPDPAAVNPMSSVNGHLPR